MRKALVSFSIISAGMQRSKILIKVSLMAFVIIFNHSCTTNDVILGDGSIEGDIIPIPDAAFGEYLFYNQTAGVYIVREDGQNRYYLNPGQVREVTTINVSKTANSTATLVSAGLATAETKITDLSGLEYFTGLTRLVLTSNSVTKLDVSKLTELASLEMNFNLVGALDLTQNTKLSVLRYAASVSGSEAQKLSTINLGNNTALVELILRDHNLTTIDLRTNTNLRDALDLSGNPGPDGNRTAANMVIPDLIYNQVRAANRFGVVSDANQPGGTIVIDGFEYEPVSANITTDQTWTRDRNYLLRSKITISTGATLTIEAGTRVFAEDINTALLIAAGSKIIARGTVNAPIKFSTLAARSSAATTIAGQWGGIFIHGRAPISMSEATQEAYGGAYGGNQANDDSGILEYVEISFAGSNVVSDNNQAGGLQLNGVGSGTKLENIYINNALRYSIQVRGGAANLKYIFINNPDGRALTWNNGYTGFIQHLAVVYRSNPSSAVSAIEGFADVGNTAGPVLSNLSINGKGGLNTRGIWFRNNARGAVHNSWITQTAAGLRVLNDLTNPNPTISNNIFWNNTADYASNADSNTTMTRYASANTTSPSIGIIQDTKGITSGGALNPASLNAWFSPSNYIGAIDPANDWTGWWD